ncbi:MAG TPA: MBL fold metallo-hydrolase [Terriglobales bacterium]|nr:MBL fold metallo-hydrolase [Terriglobales bacterium]
MPRGISITDQDIVPMEQVAPGVSGLRIVMVNVYAIASQSEWVLVDAGLYLSAGRIRRWAQNQFGDQRPSAILLTHGHFDHVGSLKELADEWEVPIYVHELEVPYLQGQKSYPKPRASAGGGFMSLLAPFYPRGPIDVGRPLQTYAADGSLPVLSDWRWIHTPGHTEGHVSFFRESDRTLIVGDAFCTTKAESALAVATQKGELHGPPAYYTSDWRAARLSVERLAALKPATVAAGHGLPMHGSAVTGALDKLAANFDTLARPDNMKRAA